MGGGGGVSREMYNSFAVINQFQILWHIMNLYMSKCYKTDQQISIQELDLVGERLYTLRLSLCNSLS